MWEAFVLSFIPLFIVIDAIGNLPFVLSMSEGLPTRQQRRMVNIAVVTATIVGLAFLFFGRAVLNAMKIHVGEFAFAGGIIVLALSINHMLTGHFTATTSKEEMVAVVPIGTPLVVGPATITTLLFLTDVQKYALYLVLLAFVLNLAITWTVFRLGFQFARFLGQGGLMAVSRVFNLLLAAIGVSMMFQGLALLNIITLPG
jgi:multiple antibiotic resistance protein